MAMTLEELRRKAGTSRQGGAVSQPSEQKMTLDELRRKAGVTAPVQQKPVQNTVIQPTVTQTAGEKSPAVSYAEKLAEEKKNQPTQKYGLIDGKVVLPSYIENQGLYAAPGTEKSKVNYLMDSAAKGLVGGALQTGEAIWQDLSGEAGKAEKAYYDYVMESAYNPQKAGQMAEYRQQMQTARQNEKLNTDTLGYKLLEISDADMAKATEGMGATGQFLTGVMGSTLQNAYLIPLAVINPALAAGLMSLSAAGRTTKEKADKGKNLDKALARGAIDGSIEYFTEKIGMDAIADLLAGQGDNIVKNVLRSVYSEAGEEGMSYLAGYVADKLSKEPDAKFSIQELALNMLAGGLSGGLLGGGTAAIGGIANIMAATQQAQPKTEQLQQNITEENTIINDNPLGHSTEEIVDIDSYKAATDPKMMAFIQKARSLKDTNVPSKISENVGTVKDTEAQEINRITGIDVSGYKRSVKGDRILHIDTKHGRNGKSDQSLAETEDIARMQWVMDNYDEIVQVIDTEGKQAYSEFFNDKDNKKAPLVAYAKAIDGVYYIVEAVPDSASKTLQLESARIIKKEVYRELNGVKYLSTNVQNGHGLASSNGSIPQTEQNVQDAADENFDTAKDINIPGTNTVNTAPTETAEAGKPFDISTLPQAEKKAAPAVSRLKEYINTLAETQGKNAEINLNKKHNGSDMTVAQFVENNADASFYKEGKLYYMEKNGKKLPVKKSMYDYAKYLQSAADTDVGAKEAVGEKPSVDTTGYGNAKIIGKKGNVDILDSVPDGWKKFDMMTAPVGYVGVTNNKSLFGGERKSALVAEEKLKKTPLQQSADNGNIKAESVGVENGKENNKSRIVQQNQGEVRTGAEIRIDRRRGTESQSSDSGIGKNRKLPEESRRERIGQGKDCVYYVISKNEYSQIAKETIKEMAKLGIKPDVYGEDMLVNGKPRGKKADATTFDDGTVAVNNNATQVPPKESAGHEAVHHYLATGNEAAIEYKRVFDENFEVLSDAAVDLTELIQKEYSGDLTEEYPSIYSGWLYDNFDEGLAYYNGCFTNETAVREAHQKFIDAITVKQNTKNQGTSSDVSNSLPENKKAEKKARPKKEKTAENKLTDFGEKIGGARKDDWRDRGLDVNDIAGMTDKEKAKFITKDNIWKKPNYEALIKEGKDKNVTYFLKTVRDALPTKPEFRTTNKELARQVQEEYVKQMRKFTDLVMSLDTKEKVMNAFDEVLVKGGYITKDSSRLYAPWHPTEKGKHIFTEKLFNAFRNAEGVNGWRYLSNKVQKDQFGVPSSEKIPKGYGLTEFDDGWAVLKGYKVISKEFATRESALSWLKENTKRTKNNRFVPPSVERVRREGVDVRKGAEVTGEKLMEAYGFRGGEFGNWTNQKERQMNLNFAFDAFHDLARTLGISEKDVSLGGKLAIAFGARGRGGANAAAAHYEPTLEVINLTRMKGAGTLGHEWAHALDDIIGEKAIGKAFTKSRGAYQAYDNLLDTMKWRDATAEELAKMNQDAKERNIKSATSWLNSVFSKYTMDKMTDSQKTEFEKLKSAFLSGEKGSVDKLNDLHKEATGRVIPSGTRNTLTTFERIWLVSDSNNRTSARVPTNFMEGSKYFDKFENRSETYWASDVEIFARAFHTYLLDKTEGKSDYLNASAEWHALPDLETGKIYRAYPYGEERTAINKAFEEFIDTLKKDGYLTTQEYDAGEMISYSTDGAKVTMGGKIVIEPKKEKAPESKQKLVPEKFAKDNNVSGKKEKVQGTSGNLPESVGAAKANPKNITHMVNEYGEIKPGENPARFVSVPVSTDGKDRVAKAIRTIMEAGVTKEKMQSRFEKLVADGVFSHDVMHNKETADRAISYIEKYGFAKTYDNWRNKIDNKLLITADDMAQAIMMYTAAADVGEYDITDILAADIAAMTVNSGQVSQVIRILKKTSPQGRLYYTQKSLEAIQDDINDKYGDKAITIEVPQEMKDAIKNAQTSEELQKATEVMHMHIAKQLPFSWSNFINSWRYLAMLGNTRTQVRNVLSNCIGTVAQEYTHFIQAAIEDTALKGKTDRTSTLKAPTQAQVDYAAKDYEVMKDSLSGKGKYKNDSLSALQSMKNPFEIVGTWGKQGDEYIGLKGVVRKGGDKTMKVLSAWNNATNWAMDKGDQIFSERAYKRFFARYLAANDINPDNITNSQLFKARNWATKQALESVYRENNDFANAISKAESKWSKSDKLLKKAGSVALGGLMPFKSTPMNITKRAFEYTPAGIVLEAMQQAYSNKTNGQAYDMPEIINKAAKSLSGTSLILLGAFLAKAGVLTGGLGDDKEDKMKKQMGQQAYSINIGDWSYTLDWGGAGMMPLFVGADIYQSNSEDDDWLMNIGNALANAGSPIIETSMMTGFMDALQSMAYEDNEIKKVGTALASALSNYIGQFVPTLFGQVARAVDDTSRSSYTNAKGVFKPIAKTVQKMENKIPGLSQKNVPYMDVWGNDVKNVGGNPLGRLAYNMLSPGYVSTKSNDKVENMLVDLYDKTGDTSVLPSNYTTSKKVDGENIRFTDKQFEQYTKAYGQTAYSQLDNLSSDKRFTSLTDEEKVEAIKKIYDYSREIASDETVNKELANTDKNRKTALGSGVPAYDVFAGKDIADKKSSINEGKANGSTSEAEAIDYINKYASSLTDIQKAYLFKVIGEDKGYTDKETSTYVKTYANAIKGITSDIKDAYRQEIFVQADSYAKALAKDKAGVKEMSKSVANKEAALNYGVSSYYVFAGKDKADIQGNGNGYTSKEEVMAYIDTLGLSPTEKAYLFAALGNSNWKNPYI